MPQHNMHPIEARVTASHAGLRAIHLAGGVARSIYRDADCRVVHRKCRADCGAHDSYPAGEPKILTGATADEVLEALKSGQCHSPDPIVVCPSCACALRLTMSEKAPDAPGIERFLVVPGCNHVGGEDCLLSMVNYQPERVTSAICPTCLGTAARCLATDLKVWEANKEKQRNGSFNR